VTREKTVHPSRAKPPQVPDAFGAVLLYATGDTSYYDVRFSIENTVVKGGRKMLWVLLVIVVGWLALTVVNAGRVYAVERRWERAWLESLQQD